MKKICKGLSVLFAAVMLLCLCVVPGQAASTAQISIRTAAASGGEYSNTTAFAAGEKLYLPIRFIGISDTYVRGFAATLTYNANALNFLEESFTGVQDDQADFYTKAQNGVISLTWDTDSKNTVFNGDVLFLVFEVKADLAGAATAPFTLSVTDFYAAGAGLPDIPYTVTTATVTAQLSPENISEETLAAFRKLETVTVDSLNDIVAAETAWNALTAKQKETLLEKYPQEYNWLSTARNRYNQAVANAGAEEILRLVEEYKTTYAGVLALTEETVTIAHEDQVNKAKIAYEALPTSVTSRLDQAIPGLLEDLLARISALRDAEAEAQEFIETYSYLTGTTDAMLESQFDRYSVLIDESVMMAGLLSPDAQQIAADMITQLQALQAKCDAILAGNEQEAAIRAEINAFQQKWLYVFSRNAGNVSVYDKSAIEMVIDDYEQLSDAAKEGLAARMRTLQGLLNVIEQLESSAEDSPTVPTIPGDSGTSGNTQPPAENMGQGNGAGNTQSPGGNTDQGNGTQGQQPEAETVTVTKYQYLDKGISLAIKILLLLLLLAVLTLLIPLIMTLKYKQRCKLLEPQPEMDDIYSSEERRQRNE